MSRHSAAPRAKTSLCHMLMSNLARCCFVATLACTPHCLGSLASASLNGLTLKIKLLKPTCPRWTYCNSHAAEVFSLWSPHQKFSNPTRKSSLKPSNDILCICLIAIFGDFCWPLRVKLPQILQPAVLQEDYHQLLDPQMFAVQQSW